MFERLDHFRLNENAQKQPDHQPTAGSDLRRTLWFLTLISVVGLISLLVWACTRNAPAATIGLGLFILGGSALVGGFFGLLFGIPKAASDLPVVRAVPAL